MTATARIHVLKSRAGLDDEAYRDLLEATTGQRSAKGLSEVQAGRVIARLEALSKGAPPRQGSAQRATGPWAPKLQALWMALHDLGAIRDRHDSAMIAFVERQTKISHPRFLVDPADARKAVEALKAMAKRAGVDWISDREAEKRGLSPVQADRWAVIQAQARILRDRNVDLAIITTALHQLGKPLPPEQLLERQTVLGREIRGREAS